MFKKKQCYFDRFLTNWSEDSYQYSNLSDFNSNLYCFTDKFFWLLFTKNLKIFLKKFDCFKNLDSIFVSFSGKKFFSRSKITKKIMTFRVETYWLSTGKNEYGTGSPVPFFLQLPKNGYLSGPWFGTMPHPSMYSVDCRHRCKIKSNKTFYQIVFAKTFRPTTWFYAADPTVSEIWFEIGDTSHPHQSFWVNDIVSFHKSREFVFS